MINAHWYSKQPNVGDKLTKPIVEYFTGERVEYAERNETGKLLGIGSIMNSLRMRDSVWGTGCIRAATLTAPLDVRFLAVRGPLTRAQIRGADIPEVYGDPALLLPLMYKPTPPEDGKRYEIGVIPHFVDRKNWPLNAVPGGKSWTMIDVSVHWPKFIDQLVQCDRIISSSLHGIVIAEAYGIPAEWAVWSDKVLGDGFKFRDYLAGTGRKPQAPGPFPPIPNLLAIQEGLKAALSKYEYKK